MELSRSQGRADQILMSLQELRGNPATPANVAAALGKMNEAYVDRFGKELKLVKDGAISGKYEHDVDMFFAESQARPRRRHRRCATPSTTMPSRFSAPPIPPRASAS